MPRRMSYRKMFLFMLPLAAVFAAGDIGQQVLNGGMARMPDAIATLAAYGLALGIKGLLSTPLIQAGQLGIGLTESHAGRLQIQRFLLVVASCIGLLLAGLGLTPIGVWLTRDLHSLTNPLGAEVQFALLCMVPLVFVDGWARYYSGLLLRYQHSGWTSAGTSARIGASIATVFALLPLDLVHSRPIWLPILVIYVGGLAEMAVVLRGYFSAVRHRLPEHSPSQLTTRQIFSFFWLLVFINAVSSGSRPIVNLFVSRGPNAEFGLAVFVIVESLAGMICGWLQELRYLPPAFRDEVVNLGQIKRFCSWCGILGVACMAAICWTPLLDVALVSMVGLEPVLAEAARAPLLIYSLLPLFTTPRSFLHGLAVVQHRTTALVPSTPVRLLVTVVICLSLSQWDIAGATLATAALTAGIGTETLVVWWCLRSKSSHH